MQDQLSPDIATGASCLRLIISPSACTDWSCCDAAIIPSGNISMTPKARINLSGLPENIANRIVYEMHSPYV